MWDMDDVINNVAEWTAINTGTESSENSMRLSGRCSPK
jgi:hypothetical protein